jgi:hypothetical protein
MLLVVGFGVVMIGFSVFKRPEFWAKIFPPEPDTTVQDTTVQDTTVQDTETQPTAERQDEQSHATGSRPLADDEFWLRTESEHEQSPATAADQPAEQTVTARKPVVDRTPVQTSPAASGGPVPALKEDLIRDVRDDTFGVYTTETDAYYVGLKMAASIKQDKAQKVATGSYALFMDAPRASRGKPWRIEGQLRRLTKGPRTENPYGGMMTLYDAWLTTADSGDQLVHAVIQSTDDSLQPHENFGDKPPNVWFTGYFFKREAYVTQTGVNSTPMFLAGKLRRIVAPTVVETRSDQLTPWLGRLAIMVCAGIILMFWSFAVSDSRNQNSRRNQLTKPSGPPSFEGITSVSVNETLRALESQNLSPGSEG